MPEITQNYIWRCAKCSYHFVNVLLSEGSVRLEKKCPKCKSLNILSLKENEITNQCKLPEAEYGENYYNQP